MKQTLLGLFALLMLSGAAFASSEGPGSGGGGTYACDASATDEDVSRAIERAKLLVPFVLNHFEAVAVEARAIGSAKVFSSQKSGDLSVPKTVFDKLFPWPKHGAQDVFERWSHLRVVPSSTSCKDEFSNDKDASAFPYDSDDICMSVSSIEAKATKVDVLQRVIALLIHEISHKMGVGTLASDHQDSVLLEEAVVAGIPTDPEHFLLDRVVELAKDTNPDSGRLVAKIQAAEQALKASSIDWGNACYLLAQLGDAGEQIGKNHNSTEGYELAIVRFISQAEEEALQKRSAQLRFYCQQDRQGRDKVSGLHHIGVGGDAVLSIANGVLRAPAYHDSATAILELQDMFASLRKIYSGTRDAKALIPQTR